MTLLAPVQTVHAAPPVQPAHAAPKADAYDDGDGDELLEHWGDPKYASEERRQMAVMAAGFLVLGGASLRRRSRNRSRCEVVSLPAESEFLTLDSRVGPRKAA